MLEVRHLKKVYRIKNEEPVMALDDVSLKFPETGLVFILGKSGSGKSTLLNVMGGLDKPDEGEIIINGKSSLEFSGSEMDSYRNTYLGFIFQEYNILSDFTVKENIALALQLQHKKATDEEIEKILQEVDLQGSGMEKRKPNELSGGQKQRVAIARALVKDPKIIFGDEPTGALDSNTGKQVFETLKKLSKDKLVIIVSHDRDFAEHFGDRVIELRDGKVISDITKTFVETKKPKEGISLVGDNLIKLDKDRLLTPADLDILNETLKKADGDVFISCDSHVNDSLMEAAKIDKSGNREEFIDTDSSRIPPSQGDFEVIKSKFSLGHAFKMGFRSLKVKPFRLVMTCLLSIVSFTMFGASATIGLFSTKNAFLSSFQKDPSDIISINGYQKGKRGYTNSYEFNQENLSNLYSETGLKMYGRSNDVYLNLPYLSSSFADVSNSIYYTPSLNGKVTIDDDFLKDTGFELVSGRMPSASGEFAVSKYIFEGLKKFGCSINDKTIAKNEATYDDVIGYKTSIYDNNTRKDREYTLTGIIDTHVPEKYDNYKDVKNSELDRNDANAVALQSDHNSWYHSAMFAYPEEAGEDIYYSRSFNFYPGENAPYKSNAYFAYLPSHADSIFYFDSDKTSLKEGETLVGTDMFANLFYEDEDKGNSVHVSFDGAYDSDGLTQYESDLNPSNALDEIDNAANRKVVYDKCEDFFDNHLDIVKDINEGKKPDVYFGNGSWTISPTFLGDGSMSFDYSDVDFDQKYRIFEAYRDCLSQSGLTDYYASYFQQVRKDYQSRYLSSLHMTSMDVLSIYSRVESQMREDYIDENYQEYYLKHKNDVEYVRICHECYGDDVDIDALSQEKKRNVFANIVYFDKSFLPGLQGDILQKFKEEISYFTFDFKEMSLDFSSDEVYFDGDEAYQSLSLSLKVVGIDFSMSGQDFSISKADSKKVENYMDESGYVSVQSPSALVCIGKDYDRFSTFIDYYMKKANKKFDDMEVGDFYFSMNDSKLSNIQFVADMLSSLTNIFVIVGAVLAVFSMLLFYNFISVSINNKKREIGILRAVGAKRIDVFKIFYSESFIIAAINFFFATIMTFVLSFVLNQNLGRSINIDFDIMNPNGLIILLILGVSLLASFISSLLPVTRIANKKPIDAIHNK